MITFKEWLQREGLLKQLPGAAAKTAQLAQGVGAVAKQFPGAAVGAAGQLAKGVAGAAGRAGGRVGQELATRFPAQPIQKGMKKSKGKK